MLKVLEHRQNHYGGVSGKVLEVMAGQGRNYEGLKQFFGEVEMLEQSEIVAASIDKQVKKYV